MFIVLFRSFLAGLELNLLSHMLSQKNVSITLSLMILRLLKGLSHDLELLNFQKMYGLLGFIRKMKVLQ